MSKPLTDFLDTLEASKAYYTLAYNRPGAIMVTVAVPGERWEFEFFNDGTVDFERFISNGVDGPGELVKMMARHEIGPTNPDASSAFGPTVP